MKNKLSKEELLEALNATLKKWENISSTDGNTDFNEGVCCGIDIALSKVKHLIGTTNE